MALSHAVNRDEINQILYHGLLMPTGLTFSPLNPYFSEESSQRYATFNPDLARNLLRDNGYVDSAGDGYRELKDGSTGTLRPTCSLPNRTSPPRLNTIPLRPLVENYAGTMNAQPDRLY